MCQNVAKKVSFTISLPVTLSEGHHANLPSRSNISKTVKVNIVFATKFFKEYLISFLMISSLIYFALGLL